MKIIKRTQQFANERKAESWIAELESKFNVVGISIEHTESDRSVGFDPVKVTVEYQEK